MRYVSLTKGRFAIIDDEDFEKVSQYKWYWKKNGIDKSGYACHKSSPTAMRMHRFIMNAPIRMEVDHINRNGLDNRKSNLRICTHQQNSFNTVKRSTSNSPYKGIEKQTFGKNWFARIRVNGKRIYLGTFISAKLAAQAYNKAAIKYFGEFSNLNKIV